MRVQERKAAYRLFVQFNSSNGLVARASTSGAVGSDLIPNLVKPLALNLIFTADECASCAFGKGT